MQKLEILVWTGKQYTLMAHDWIVEEVNVNRATVSLKLKAPEPKEENKSESKPKVG